MTPSPSAEPRIAVVEDEPAIAEVVEFNLLRAGLRVDVYDDGLRAWRALSETPPDLVVLDLMLPGIDGLELCRRLRKHGPTSAVPVVMLTAKAEEIDRIVGLELGADDYLTKPFSPRELVLRVRAILRRAAGRGSVGTSGEELEEWIEVGLIRLDASAHRAFVDGAEAGLTATEFRLLEKLLRGAGRTYSRTQLLQEVWGYASDVDSRTVDTHVRRLRRKLKREAGRLETVIGVGYRLRS